jgi:hypothetical protein
MVGKGIPFSIIGGNTFIDDVDYIEEWLMNNGDMDLTLNWAMLLQIAKQFGISKKDIGNMFSGSIAVILGLDTEFFGVPLPFGGYIALIGKDGAAERFANAIHKALDDSSIVTELKTEEWNKLLAVSVVPNMPSVIIAQKEEALLLGVMNPEEIEAEINIEEIGIPSEKMLSWIILNTERMWKVIHNAYAPLSVMILSGLLGDISANEKEAILFAQNFTNTDFPMNAFSLWAPSIDELEIIISMNPSPEGDFWRVFFEWLFKIIDY